MPYCILGWKDEHIEGQCSLRESGISEDEPLGITLTSERAARTPKEDDRIADVKSTGRKRAVQVKPIPKEGMTCEWSRLKLAGGAIFPIVGCLGNPATDIHHGPDKNTLNNTLDNLHRLCSTCHNRFHALNDPTYPPENIGFEWRPVGICVPHDSVTIATPEEYLKAEIFWKTPVADRK